MDSIQPVYTCILLHHFWSCQQRLLISERNKDTVVKVCIHFCCLIAVNVLPGRYTNLSRYSTSSMAQRTSLGLLVSLIEFMCVIAVQSVMTVTSLPKIQGVSQKSVINLTVVRGCLGKYFGIGNIGSQQLIKGWKTWVKLALCPCNKKW